MTVSTAPRARVICALPHAVADHLAATEFHLLAVSREILLDLDEQLGVGEPHAVTFGWTEHVGIGGAREGGDGVAGHGIGSAGVRVRLKFATWQQSKISFRGVLVERHVVSQPASS